MQSERLNGICQIRILWLTPGPFMMVAFSALELRVLIIKHVLLHICGGSIFFGSLVGVVSLSSAVIQCPKCV